MQKKLGELFGTNHGLDEKSVQFLTGALERNNLPGFDYLEFKLSLRAMDKLGVDETTAFKTAFATASTVGLTKEKLLKTAQHYKSVLSTERQQFEEAMQKQVQQKVDAKKTEVEKLRIQVEEFKKRIKQLEDKINSSQEVIDTADQTINEAKSKIESTRDGFESTLQSLMNEIKIDIERINNYL